MRPVPGHTLVADGACWKGIDDPQMQGPFRPPSEVSTAVHSSPGPAQAQVQPPAHSLAGSLLRAHLAPAGRDGVGIKGPQVQRYYQSLHFFRRLKYTAQPGGTGRHAGPSC